MNSTALVLFAFNRPYHTLKTIESLKENNLWDQQHVRVYCDGQKKTSHDSEILKIQQTREIIKKINGCASLTIIERPENIGLFNNIVQGVTETLKEYDRIIVLEDDMLTSRDFLSYHYKALNIYQTSPEIWCNSGYVYPIKPKDQNHTFFLSGADCWGWSTWKDRWSKIELDGSKLIQTILDQNRLNEFTFNGSYPYDQMLLDTIAKKNQSWAILWYASAFVSHGLCSYPPHTLLENIGTDGSGTHSTGKSSVHGKLNKRNQDLILQQIKSEDPYYRVQFEIYFKRSQPIKKWSSRLLSSFQYRSGYYLNKIKRSLSAPTKKYGWFGDYSSWSEAERDASGYDSDLILDKVRDALLKVKFGMFRFERDSFNFNSEVSPGEAINLISSLSTDKKDTLHVLDFGGSLGSTYFRFVHYHPDLQIKWSIVEQEKFVKAGKEYFESSHLLFFSSINDATKTYFPDVVLLSSVLQYLENPNDVIEQLNTLKSNYILIDRTAIIEREKDRITLQIVPPEIYEASYPAWYFNEDRLLKKFTNYKLVKEFESPMDPREKLDGELTYRKGYLLKLKE